MKQMKAERRNDGARQVIASHNQEADEKQGC